MDPLAAALAYYKDNPLDLGGAAEAAGLPLEDFERRIYKPNRRQFLLVDRQIRGLLQSLCAKSALGLPMPPRYLNFDIKLGFNVLKMLDKLDLEEAEEEDDWEAEIGDKLKEHNERIESILSSTPDGGDNPPVHTGGARRVCNKDGVWGDSESLSPDTGIPGGEPSEVGQSYSAGADEDE